MNEMKDCTFYLKVLLLLVCRMVINDLILSLNMERHKTTVGEHFNYFPLQGFKLSLEKILMR